MKYVALLLMLAIISVRAYSQNTPAPCDPANIQYTDVQYGCAASPDCVSGFICFFLHVGTDVVYGTTCSAEGQYLCGRPYASKEAAKIVTRQKAKNAAQVKIVLG